MVIFNQDGDAIQLESRKISDLLIRLGKPIDERIT